MNNEYQDIIQGIKALHSVQPSAEFRASMRDLALSDHSPVFFFSVIRLAIVLIALLLLGGAGVVVASTQSNPGDLLYPIKEIVEQAKTHFISQPPEPEINPKSKTINMNVDSKSLQDQQIQPSPSLPASSQSINTGISAAPTQVPLSTPTPTQSPTQQEVQIPQVNAAVATPILPVNVGISIGSPPAPTPTLALEGSKELNNGAGNASLLPNIQVNIPLPGTVLHPALPPVHLGL